jgi:outer membrane beta-barrel protein
VKLAYTLVLLTLSILPAQAFAIENDIYTTPKLVAVQNRKYNVNKNISVHLGYIPDDAFTKGYLVGGAYTYYFSDFAAWETINANYVFKSDTGLLKDIKSRFALRPEDERALDFVEYYVTTGFVYTPIYNKNLFFNSKIVNGEQSFVVMGGLTRFYKGGFLPAFGGGIIFKYFISEKTSVKLDFRDLVAIDPERGLDGIIELKVGLDIALGDTPRSAE